MSAKGRPAPRTALLVATSVFLLLAACSATGGASLDPQASCSADGQRPGAYPDLEARLPATFEGAAPARLDSGRNCSEGNLGTLIGHGVRELRFAGGLWETGARSGVTIAVFQADGLTVQKLAEFYEMGARQARKTEAITTDAYSVGGAIGRRIDTLNDESFQTIVVLEGPEPGVVRAVLVASDIREVGTRDAHDETVRRAAEAAAAPARP